MLPLHIPENIRISGFEMILGDKYKKVTFGTNGLSKWHEKQLFCYILRKQQQDEYTFSQD